MKRICALLMLVCLISIAFAQSAATTSAPAATSKAATASSPATRPVTGTVKDADGKAVTGAAVRVYDYSSMMRRQEAMTVIAQTLTGADGTFTSAVPADEEHQLVVIIARKDGLSLGWATSHDSTAAEIVLRKPSSISGTVVDEAGKPVKGATVYCMPATQYPGGYWAYSFSGLCDLLMCKSDQQGRFTQGDLPSEAVKVDFIVEAPGMARTMTYKYSQSGGTMGKYAPGETDVKIEMAPESRLVGVVTDKASGKPVADATVMVSGDMIARTAKADADGKFVATGLAAGVYVVSYVGSDQFLRKSASSGYIQQLSGSADWISGIKEVQLSKAQEGSIKIELTKGGMLQVAVKEQESGKPISRAWVALSSKEAIFGGTADASGILSLRVPPGDYRLTSVYKQGYKRWVESSLTSATGPATPGAAVAEGQVAKLTAELERPPVMKGVVKDKDGKPVAGAKVSTLYGGDAVDTDQDGKFELPSEMGSAMFGEKSIQLMARHKERNLVGSGEAQEGQKDVEIRLQPAVSVIGTVVDSDGKALADAKVSLTTWMGRGGIGTFFTSSDKDGKFRIGDLCPGVKYTVQASGDEYGQAGQTIRPDDSPAETDLGKFVLPPAKLTLSGIVVDADGKPVADAMVNCQGNGQPMRQTQSDKDGRWELKGIIDGKLMVGASSSTGSEWGSASPKGGDTDVTIAMKAPSRGPTTMGAEERNSLLNKPLPGLDRMSFKNMPGSIAGKKVLLVMWDMNQRPSRRCVQSLAEKAKDLQAAGVVVLLFHAPTADVEAPGKWLTEQKITLPSFVRAPGTFTSASSPTTRADAPHALDVDKVWKILSGRSLPWLVLTDEKRVVQAEGFSLEELDSKTKAQQAQTQPAAGK